jgi:hypothetical protein
MLKLIQKNNNRFVMAKMCTCMILLLLRLVANILMNTILIMAKKRLNLTNLRIEMYHAEGPIPKAPVAPDPLIVSYSKSRTTVGAGRCTPCRPSNVHREVDKADPRKKGHHKEGDEDVPMKKKMASSHGDALQKPDCLYTPEQMSRCEHGHVLITYTIDGEVNHNQCSTHNRGKS